MSSLNDVVMITLDTDVRFVVGFEQDGRSAGIQPSKTYRGSLAAFPLVRPSEDPDVPALLLRANYRVEMSKTGGYLRIVISTIGLWVDVTAGRRKHRPLVRLEYDRYPRTVDRPAGHVHLHANSPEMAWVYGSSGRATPDLHALHFPVGREQFQPTFEDFLLFLNREKLYTDFKPNWRPEILRSLRGWRDLQAAATVKQYPELAAGVLEGLGYGVVPPGG